MLSMAKKTLLAAIIGSAFVSLTGCSDSSESTTPSKEPVNQSSALKSEQAGDSLLYVHALYNERMMVPPGSELNVVLIDTARADAPANILTEHKTKVDSAPPYPVELKFYEKDIVNKGRYGVRASLKDPSGNLLFTTMEFIPAFDAPRNGIGQPLIITMKKIPDQNKAVGLFETRWLLKDGQSGYTAVQPFMQFIDTGKDNKQKRLAGYSGCNELHGSFTLADGNKISFGDISITERKCTNPELMEQERALLEAFKTSTSYTVGTEGLKLINADGNLATQFIVSG